MLGSVLGGFGALLSILPRTRKMQLDPTAGRFIHYVESSTRILIGIISAFIVALAIKANIVLGAIVRTADNPLAYMLAICTISGASERTISSFIKRIETSSGAKGHEE